MPERKGKAKKPKGYERLSQKDKFIAAAKASESDETGETFTQAMTRIVPVAKGRPKKA